MRRYKQNQQLLKEFLTWEAPGLPIPANEVNLRVAAGFALLKWQERRRQWNILRDRGTERPIPTDLSGACKFCSMFAVKVFGGEMRGNSDHQWVELDGQIIDLTANVDGGKYEQDDSFWLNEEHLDGLVSCIDRVKDWLAVFVDFLGMTERPQGTK